MSIAWLPENSVRVRTHPGKILAECLSDYGMSAEDFAARIGVPANKLKRVLICRGRIDGNLALRIGRAFDTTAQYWINMMSAHELSKAHKRFLPEINQIEKLPDVILADD